MEKCVFVEPELEVILFDSQDILTASSGTEILPL